MKKKKNIIIPKHKKLSKKIFNSTFTKYFNMNQKKKLDKLYLFDNYYFYNIELIKAKKDNKSLFLYQNDLLKYIRPTISQKGYEQLKKGFSQIRKKADKNYISHINSLNNIQLKGVNTVNNFRQTTLNFKKINLKKELPLLTSEIIQNNKNIKNTKFIKRNFNNMFSTQIKTINNVISYKKIKLKT